MEDKPKESKRYVDALSKGLEVIDCIGQHQPISLMNLSLMLDITPSRIMRLCGTMGYYGYVVRDKNKQYRLGYKLLSLGRIYEHSSPILVIIKPELERLSQKINSLVSFFVLLNDRAICIARIGTSNSIPLTYIEEEIDHFHCGAVGKIFLTYGPAWLRAKYFTDPDAIYKKYTPQTITSPVILYDTLKKIRKKGYCLSIEEQQVGLASLGVPVFKSSGEILGVLLISGETSQTMYNDSLEEHVSIMKASASYLSQQLIY